MGPRITRTPSPLLPWNPYPWNRPYSGNRQTSLVIEKQLRQLCQWACVAPKRSVESGEDVPGCSESHVDFEPFDGFRRPARSRTSQDRRPFRDLTLTPDRILLESELLITQFQRGERAAFERIVRLWERSVFYYLRRLTSSEADAWDFLQETWLKTYRSIDSLRDPRSFPAFLYTTARNTAISRLRGKHTKEVQLDIEDVSTCEGGSSAFDDAEQVHFALDQLPLPQREALTLYFLNDLSIDEISRVLGLPVGTVKSRLHYAKQALRTIILKGDDHER